MTERKEPTAVFPASQLAQATGGCIVRRGMAPVRSVSIDSRITQELSLFVPLRGERVDGHSFIAQALSRGAVAVLVEHRFYQAGRRSLEELFEKTDATAVVVENTLFALQDLARFHLNRFPALYRIGITGSSGKTTTKELIGSILRKFAPTMVSRGNLNSEIGVPLSSFEVNAGHRYAVFEMGINHEGEMDVLASIVKPDLALITNIGTAHVGILGSQSKIALEKKKIAGSLKKDEALFLFEKEVFYDLLSRDIRGKAIRYGPSSTQGIKGSKSLGLDGTAIDWEELSIRFPLVGSFNYHNALGAISVASFLGVPPHIIKQGLEEAQPLFGRGEVVRGAISIIKDFYNANPDSVEQSLRFLHDIDWGGRKIAVLGSMLELGKDSAALHGSLGKLAAGLSIDALFFFGRETEPALEALRAEKFRGIAEGFIDFTGLEKRVTEHVRPGDLVLVKGSRGMELERLIEPIRKKGEKGSN